jgi:hypothetical protein
MICRSQLGLLTQPDAFRWAVGIEDTFITEPWAKTGRILDEYELTGHYEHWRADLDLMASLGVDTARYGIPWHRVNPGPNRWEWSWVDEVLGRLLDLDIDPIIDLVHYGVPQWIDDAFLNPSYPERVAEYAARFAERFRGRIHAYSPLNEPRITAWYCGRLGWWPPYRTGWRGFVAVLLQVCRGIVATSEALLDIDPENVLVHVEPTEIYSSNDPELADEVKWRQELLFLALDLISGRVDQGHAFRPWLLKHGATEDGLRWFSDHGPTVPLDVIGIDLYPMFSNKWLKRAPHLRARMPYGSAKLLEDIAELYWRRYCRPVMITETATRGEMARRLAWLHDSVDAVRHLRERGVPLVGYTWWPMFALVQWAYRQGDRPPHLYLEQMGLWDLAASTDGQLRRVHTPMVDAYRQLVARGPDAVGRLASWGPCDPRETL